MEKENGEGDKGGPDSANLLDAASLFAYWPRGDTSSAAGSSSLFGGIPGGFSNHLGASGYMMGGGRSGSGGSYSHQQVPTTGSYGSLGTLSVAASQAASLGINPASAAWWTMASHLAAQDYLARLQASAAASGIQFGGLPDSLVPGYPGMLPTPHTSHHGSRISSSKSNSSKYTSGSKAHTTTTMSMQMPCLAGSGGMPSSRDRDRDREREREQRDREQKRERELIREAREAIASTQPSAAHQPSSIASILGGVRLPPDTEIIKYTSSIVGPKVPGTTNRGRKKTISLDPPSVSVMPSLSSTGLPIDRSRGRNRQRHSAASLSQDPTDYRGDGPASNSLDRDRVEVIKLPAHSSNGTASLNIPTYGGSASQFTSGATEADAPLNLSLKPTSLTGAVPSSPLQALALSAGATPHDRISRRKGGGGGQRPRRVAPTVTAIPASPSPSLAQLFAAADSPRPSSGSEENDSTHHKDGRPRNLGRGVSKPKKNTVASLLAQSRALGIKPVQGLELSPLNHQVSLLKSNILAAQQQLAANKERDGDERQSNEDRERSPSVSSEDRHRRHGNSGMSSSRTEGVVKVKPRQSSDLASLAAASNALGLSNALSSLKDIVSGALSESSAGDVSSDSVSDDSDTDEDLSESGSKRDGDESGRPGNLYNCPVLKRNYVRPRKQKRSVGITKGPPVKRRKTEVDERELRIPLEHGWRRETVITGVSRVGTIRGEVSYFSPCGRKFKQISDIVRYLEKMGITDMNRESYSFSAKLLLGDYLQPTSTDEMMRLTEDQVLKRLDELKLVRGFHRMGSSRQAQDQKLLAAVEREKMAQARRQAKEDAARQKEQSRLMKEQDKCLRQEALRREREQRNQQMIEGRRRLAFTTEQKLHIVREVESGKSKSNVSRSLGLASSTVGTIWKNRQSILKSAHGNDVATSKTVVARRRRHEELEKQRQEEHARKQQLYMQELNKQREMLYTVELERERRRQHMALVKALESRKRLEERERKRQELRAEKIASKERKMEQRRLELELVRELRKPAEDMELNEQKPLPTLNRIPGLKLSGQAFADSLMVFEFLHNFGETLGFDMESLPSLNSLQMALLNDEEAEEELLSVMTHLLVCAIEDPGIPNPARHTTILGQSLKQADITHTNLSEILRIYLYANATGEVKALTGLHFERDREKKSDHHNSFGEAQSPACGKNAAFFEHLRDNFTWQMSEWLSRRPFLSLNPTHKAAILAFLCNELLQNKAVLRQIDGSIESAGQLRKDRWLYDTRMRKLRMLHGRRVRQVATTTVPKAETSGCEESSDADKKEAVEEDEEVEEEEDGDSAPESDTGTQPEEEEDKNLNPDELGRKLEKVSKQYESAILGLSQSTQQLRATCLGQDRYWRRYWALPCTGAVFVEAMESSNPPVYGLEEDRDNPREETAAVGVYNAGNINNEAGNEEVESKGVDSKEPVDDNGTEAGRDMVSEPNGEESKACDADFEAKSEEGEKKEEEREDEGMEAAVPNESVGMEKKSKEEEEEEEKNEESRLDDGMGEDSSTEADDNENEKSEAMDVDEEKKIENTVGDSYDSENEHRKRRTRETEGDDVVEAESINEKELEPLDIIDNLLPKDAPVESEVDSSAIVKSELPNEVKEETDESKTASETSESRLVAEDKDSVKREEVDNDVSERTMVKCEADVDKLESETKFKVEGGEVAKTEDALSSVKVEIKSDLFGAELKAPKVEVADEKVPFHRPFERLVECVEREVSANQAPVVVAPNGDKFNALNHLYTLGASAAAFNGGGGGRELNGGFPPGAGTGERNWFSVLPRDACDSTSVTNSNSSIRFAEGCSGSELRIPVFPHPSRLSSPSPGGSQCESPGPLVLTPDEMVQLEYMKKSGGLMRPQPVKPVPPELRRGWWRITDQDQLRTILNNLHTRGFRESQLKRILTKYMDHSLESCGRLNIVRSGDKAATELAITDMDHKVSALPGGAPLMDAEDEWDREVALRVDMFMLEQVEGMEDKVANASMQVKGWKVPPRATTEEGAVFRPACLPDADVSRRNPVEIAKDRLISLEAAIERRYLKPPLGISTGDLNLQGMQGEVVLDDALPKGLVTWREAVSRAQTAAQLAMALYMLEASVAWDKSIMKAVSCKQPCTQKQKTSGKGFSNCQFCHSGDNEDKLLLCDGCDKGYHTYCFKPKMDNIPDGDWYCYECMNKATGERNCIVCGKKAAGKNLVLCDLCPRAYHCDCLQAPLGKVPRGKWYCPTCSSKQPRKRGAHRRSKPRDTSESSDHTPSSPTPTIMTEETTQCAASPDPTPPPPRKERGSKKLIKDLKPCIALMEDLEAHDEAWPFLLPVNTKQFPTYKKIIKNPMDLSTIKKKLLDTGYKGREEFCTDVRQIFNNCETFNEDDSPVGKAGHSMRLFFEARWTEINTNHPKTATP